MNVLKKKLGKTGGFTLIEMLIVVAIIAILVAISIPLINSALERARDATDEANERAAKAEAVVIYMGVVPEADPNHADNTAYKNLLAALTDPDTGVYYDAANGNLKLAANKGDIVAYGQCTGCESAYAKSGSDNTGKTSHAGLMIKIAINPDASGIGSTNDEMFTIEWE